MEPVMIAVLAVLVIVCGLILGKLFTIFAERQPKAVCQFCQHNLPITLAYDSDINWHTTCVKHAAIKIKIDNLERELLDSQEPMAIVMGAPLTTNEQRITNLMIPSASYNKNEVGPSEAGYDIVDGYGNLIVCIPPKPAPLAMPESIRK